MSKTGAGLRRSEIGYRSRFTANGFICELADRIEDLVKLSASALLRSSMNVLNPKARRLDVSSMPCVPEGLVTRRIIRCQASLPDLIEACVVVKRRAMMTKSRARQGQKGNYAEICPQDPVGRVQHLSAPLPIGRPVLALSGWFTATLDLPL